VHRTTSPTNVPCPPPNVLRTKRPTNAASTTDPDCTLRTWERFRFFLRVGSLAPSRGDDSDTLPTYSPPSSDHTFPLGGRPRGRPEGGAFAFAFTVFTVFTAFTTLAAVAGAATFTKPPPPAAPAPQAPPLPPLPSPPPPP
jgi:hypothetical protein